MYKISSYLQNISVYIERNLKRYQENVSRNICKDIDQFQYKYSPGNISSIVGISIKGDTVHGDEAWGDLLEAVQVELSRSH